MQELTQNIKFQIERAISTYILICSVVQNLSKRKTSDIHDLRKILILPSHDIYSKLTKIKNRLNKMKTGWWIFDFGHSKLKNLIGNEIKTLYRCLN